MCPDASIIPLSRFRHDMGQALSRRGQALVHAPDMAEQVAAMGTTELYFMVKEMGVDEALPLLMATAPEQFQALCDLDCWDGDTFDPVELDAWLAPFASEGDEALAQAFLSLDEELQVMFLQASVQVFDGRADEAPDFPEDLPSREVPGGLFTLLALTTEREVEPLKLVDALMAVSMEELYRLLTAAKWELGSTLQEQAHHFRQSRMMDLGFMEAAQAARLFAPPPRVLRGAPEQLLPPLVPQAVPAVYAAALLDDTALIARALGQVTDPVALRRLETELVVLINGAIVAWSMGLGNLGKVAQVAQWVRNVLSLSLEALLGSAVDADPGALGSTVMGTPLLHLFQRGMHEILPLTARAQALCKEPWVAAWLEHDSPPEDDPEGHDRAFVRGVARARPVWAGADPVDVRQIRMWQHLSEIHGARDRLEAIAARLRPVAVA